MAKTELNINQLGKYNPKLISDSLKGVEFTGNYTPPYVTSTITSAKDLGLSFVHKNTTVYKGTGFKASGYSAFAGVKVDLTGLNLSDFGAIVGDKIGMLFYLELIEPNNVLNVEHNLQIGTNKIPIHLGGTGVTVTNISGTNYKKYEVSHTITASDISQDSFVKFEVRIWANADSALISTQSVALVEPLIWLNNINLDFTLRDVEREMVDAKVESFKSTQSPFRGLIMRVEADSIGNYNQWQPVVKSVLELAELRNFSFPGRSLAQCYAELNAGGLNDVDIVLVALNINDYLGNAVLGSISDDDTVNSIYGRVRKVIKRTFDENPTVKLGFITCLPTKNDFGSGAVYNGVNSIGYTVNQAAQAVLDVCASESIPCLNMMQESGISSINIDSISADGIHPIGSSFKFLKNTYAYKIIGFVNNIIGK